LGRFRYFLLAMKLMETSLEDLAERSFKPLLRNRYLVLQDVQAGDFDDLPNGG